MNGILYDIETKDMAIENGDFALGDITRQNQELLIVSRKCEFTEHPTVGVGAVDFIDDDENTLIREIRKELVKDGQNVKSLNQVGNGTINVDASYG